MKKILSIGIIFIIALLFSNTSNAVPPPPIFDIVITSSVTDAYDYDYILYYSNYDPDEVKMRGISHWWLEINCAHSSIDVESIYGYSIINDVRYDWIMDFDDNLAQVGGYTDWVIKWDVPELPQGVEIPKDPGSLIGYFGYHSTQPPVTGSWGGKGGTLFDNGTTLRPMSTHGSNIIPEPTGFVLFGIGITGFGLIKRRKK